MRQLEPFGERVVLRAEKPKDVTDSGLVLAPGAIEAPAEAVVLACGPDVQVVQAGDRVIYPKYAGTEVSIDGDTVLVMKASELTGKLVSA